MFKLVIETYIDINNLKHINKTNLLIQILITKII